MEVVTVSKEEFRDDIPRVFQLMRDGVEIILTDEDGEIGRIIPEAKALEILNARLEKQLREYFNSEEGKRKRKMLEEQGFFDKPRIFQTKNS